MTLLHFYLTCVPDCTLIKNKLIVLPDDNNAKSSNTFSDAENQRILTNNDKILKLAFPFLDHPPTVKYIKHSKVMFIMRGLAGSGKTTIVRSIHSVYPRCAVCSADDYFLKDGIYNFDPTKLGFAHETCQLLTEQYCWNGCPVVTIDNTNVKRWEMTYYLDLAFRTNYVVVLVEPQTPWKFDAKELATRNKHGVSEDILQFKVQLFQDFVPSYYGWFLNEADSKFLLNLARQFFEECMNKIPELKQCLLTQLRWNRSFPPDRTEVAFGDYFYHPDNNDLLHCTSKFLAHGKVPGALDYHYRRDVQENCGRASCLIVTSIMVTERTVGARVKLKKKQLQLFDKPEERERDGLLANKSVVQEVASGAGVPIQRLQLLQEVGAPENQSPTKGISSGEKSVKTINHTQIKNEEIFGNLITTAKPTDDFESNIYKIIRSKPTNTHSSLISVCQSKEKKVMAESYRFGSKPSFGRSTHITLATADGIQPRQTNFDVLDICDVEADSPFEGRRAVPVHGGFAVYLGNGMCCIYLYKPLVVWSLFSGHY